MRADLVRGLRIISAILLLSPAYAYAEAVPAPATAPEQLIISEIKIKNYIEPDEPDEFIELYNNSNQPVNLGDYQLIYYNAYDPINAKKVIELELEDIPLSPYEYYVLASDTGQIPGSVELPYINFLKDDEGRLRLLGSDIIVPDTSRIYDEIAWLQSCPIESCPDGVVRLEDDGTKSLQRVSTRTTVPVILDIDWQSESPTPFYHLYVEPPPPTEDDEEPLSPGEADTEPDGTSPDAEEPAAEETEPTTATPPVASLPLRITEVLPNPAPPLTDTLDEFVEIFNPNDGPVDVSGYKVQTGNTYSYSYELDDLTIPARGYITVTSGNTNLALANSGGKARLLDPAGVVISETPAYGEASEGQAWADVNGVWQWTTTPTPLAENSLVLPVAAPKTSVKKAPAAKKKAAAKPKAAAKKAAAKGVSTKKKPVNTGNETAEVEEPEIIPVHTGTLAIIGGLTLVYAGYEYRHDMLNRIYRIRRYFETRRAARG